MGKYLQQCGPWVLTGCTLLFQAWSRSLKCPTGQRRKGDLWVPNRSRRNKRWIYIQSVARYYVHMYIMTTHKEEIVHINYVQTTTRGPCPPALYFGVRHNNIYRTKRWNKDVPLFTNLLSRSTTATPLHLWHTLGGKSSQQHSAYRYYILELKE